MRNVIPIIIYLFLVALHMVILRDATSIWGISCNLPATLVLLISMYKSDLFSSWMGFAIGLMMSVGTPSVMGWQALIMAMIGFFGCHVRVRLNLESFNARLLMILGGVFIHNVMTLLISGTMGFFYLLWSSALPGAVYSTLVAWVFFLLYEKKVTIKKLKSFF